MCRTAFAIPVAAFLIAAGVNMAFADEPCDLSPITRPLKNATLGSYPVTSIGIGFRQTGIAIPSEEGITFPYKVALPEVTVELDVSSHPKQVEAKLSAFSGSLPGVDSAIHINGTRTSGRAIIVSGDVNIQKWISMTGFECTWHSEWWGGYPECRATEWKTKILDQSFDLHVDTKLTNNIVFPINPKPATDEPVSDRNNYDASIDVGANSIGAVNWHISNDIERFLADALTWLASAISRKDFNNWNLEHELPQLIGNDQVTLDARNLLYPTEKTLIYRDGSQFLGSEGYRGFWQIFVDTLSYNEGQSGYITSGSAPLYRMSLVYTQDNLLFGKRLKENRNKDDTTPLVDPFEYTSFCQYPDARKMVTEYIDEIAKKLDKKEEQIPFSGSLQDLRARSISLFGTARIAPVLIGRKFVELGADGLYAGRFPNSAELIEDPSIILPWDTVETLGRYFDITGERLRCLASKVDLKNGSENLLRPYQEFEPCGSGVTTEQSAAIDEAAQISSMNPLAVFDGFTEPVKNATYRGWYYCYQNPRICSGRNNIYWWQQPSKYNERGGNHKGVDLFGDDGQGTTNIYAATSGTLVFSDRDPNGWGNALLIPFEKDGVSYFAVYAHLPASARNFDGKKVKKGDPIGNTGCSGNSGDGRGSCNTYCLWSGQTRTDEHLHFEIIKKTTAGNETVDPVSFTNITIASDGRSFRVTCENSTRVATSALTQN
ncbi:M23 family metallopeptidase [Rhizobium ruizarguesonis]